VGSNDLILGLAAGYHYGDVLPFLRSLEMSGFEGRCVLFVSDTTRDLDRIGKLGAELIPLTRPDRLAHLPYNALRYFLYLDFLREADASVGRVLLSDVRDVVFQRDPFAFPWPAGLNCALEDQRMTLGACPHNSHWIRTHLGGDALDAVREAPISCSGTTVGDREAVVRYLEILTARLLPFNGGKRMAGYDQGVHNVLIRTGALGAPALHGNDGPILTLGYTRGEPATDDDGRVLNQSGEPAFIVHQYDRKPGLFRLIREQYTWTVKGK
jgi:hypothetical protein